MTALVETDLFATVACTCEGCAAVSHPFKHERRWMCYSCGRGNQTTGATARPEGEDPFAEFLEYSGASR